jgi:hypothetical protein
MSDAGERLERTRMAILEQAQRRDQHARARQPERHEPEWHHEEQQRGGGNWFGGLRHALGTWWRHHPAHMGVELATPVLSAYARHKPLQFLGIAAALGAVIVVARPWRVITVGGLLAALLKSSQLSGLVMSALSAADFQKVPRRPPWK